MLGRRAFMAGAAWLATPALGRAATTEVRIARQPSLGHLPLMIMEDQHLFEAEAAARGLGAITPVYTTLAGGAAMNDGLLSGALHFVAGGVPPLVLLWSKTRDTSLAVKGVAAMNSMPLLMNTVNPRLKTLRDFTDADRIALPAVKVSVQAMFLQMAAEKELGPDHRTDLDKLTVTLSHPDGMAAMFSGQVTAHFTAAPIQELELARPGVHTVLNTFDILGEPSTFNVVWSTSRFIGQNPGLHAAFLAALGRAIAIITSDKAAAAATYVRLGRDGSDVGLIRSILDNPSNTFTTTPQAIQRYVDFMARAGIIRTGTAHWQDLFFAPA